MGDARVFGDYGVIKQIGQGTLGTVYLAEHRFMKRQYVLKVLPEELASDRSFVQRLEEEIDLLSSLEHPNIVKIHNISFAQGQYFLVNDCIVDELGETTNLAQYISAQGKLLEEETIYCILEQIAKALHYAHQKKGAGKGVAHRGIKLNNILVGNNGQDGLEVYLSDFGLSRIVGTAAVLTRMYQTMADNLGIGIPVAQIKNSQRYPNPPIEHLKLPPLHLSFIQNYYFLAPEQKRIDHPTAVDTKSDIYAFGVLAYYLLTGEFPEGVFDMPSARRELAFNWDILIRESLQADSSKRIENLISIMETMKQPLCSTISMETESLGWMPVAEKEPLLAARQKVISRGDAQTDTLRPVIHTTQLERPQTDLDPASAFVVDTTVKYYVPERKEVKNINPILTDMVIIPGGTYYRGSNEGNRDEVPRHPVTLDGFALDIHPVTNEQFVRFLEAMGGEKDGNHHDIIRLRDSRLKRTGGKLSIESGYAKHPVVGVTWYGAVGYAKWLGKRLPTEAEWEIAAYGGLENALYQTGDDIEKSQANFFSSDTTPVMSYVPNGYGIYDMAGNVYEWCYDWYGYNYYEISLQEPENPPGPLQGVYRVMRGGCWKSLKEDLRCSHRHRNNPGAVNGTYGFRCAADVQ